MDPVARIENDFLAWLEAGENLSFAAARASGLDRAQFGATGRHGKRRPRTSPAKQGAGGNLDGAVGFPDDDPRFDAKLVAQIAALFGRCEEIRDDVDALFLNPQGGDFGERRGFDEPNLAAEGCAAAPLFEINPGARQDCGAIAGQDFDDHLEIGRIANFEKRRSGGDDAGVFLEDPENASGGWSRDFNGNSGGRFLNA